jgi:hypothetical protein
MGVIERAAVPVAIKNDNVELRTAPVGELTVGFVEIQKGTDLGPALVGLPGDLCQCPHWGYMLKGRVMMRTEGGDEIYEAGQAFLLASRSRTDGSRGLRVCGLLTHRRVRRCDSPPHGRHIAAAPELARDTCEGSGV